MTHLFTVKDPRFQGKEGFSGMDYHGIIPHVKSCENRFTAQQASVKTRLWSRNRDVLGRHRGVSEGITWVGAFGNKGKHFGWSERDS